VAGWAMKTSACGQADHLLIVWGILGQLVASTTPYKVCTYELNLGELRKSIFIIIESLFPSKVVHNSLLIGVYVVRPLLPPVVRPLLPPPC
jgi:hypothetical protein